MERKYRYCDVCRMCLDENGFFRTNNTKKYPNGRLTTCKKCVTRHLNNWEPETFLPLLQEVDVPYIKQEWDAILDRACHRTDITVIIGPFTVIGKYLAKMRLKGFKALRYSDTERINKENQEREERYNGYRNSMLL